jgi:radical SAM protein with 4Fe4S-binding SPASM domain
MNPTSAVVAVTLNCNARCLMCDIWKQSSTGEMQPDEYLRLPASLREINLTGGEPFLRRDLPEVVAAVRQACPRARVVISTNGLLVDRIQEMVPRLLRPVSGLGVRVSIDGLEETHDRLRGVPGGFMRTLRTLEGLREAGVQDLGVGMTLLAENVAQVGQVYRLAEALGIEFSVTLASDSPIYFGDDKARLRPRDGDELPQQLRRLAWNEYRRARPKHWFRAWFEEGLAGYARHGRRPLACDAGQGFFYLDPEGSVFCCHLLPHRLGGLREQDWASLWSGAEAERTRRAVAGCQACWMVCSARSQMRRHLPRIGARVLAAKLQAHLRSVQGDAP